MSLSLEEVRRIAALARLRLSPEEEERFAGQLSAILDHVRLLEELDVAAVEPMTHALAGEAPALRADLERPGLSAEVAVAAAPERAGTHFKVPRVLE
ncbi:MAG TPA: Asp-tRNA(Asn)/Glu-tRNA(Gln) amidotransferase subunit GatC [Anaeromyxobacter sp.]|nr:Asp-tRNA(Asn)/Glu-tRNA(Gln) amidotransferase subunit GatC [Anaeromyxobacter sp.]